jgi:hypothetical protein
MAGEKLYYIPWETGDWLKDPAVSLLKPATRGILMDAICVMHELDQCGQIEGSFADLARLCRCTSSELRAALDDLAARNAADVTERNGIVTLVNRRMRRAFTGRKSNRERQKRFRNKIRDGPVTGDVTPSVTDNNHSHSHNQNPPDPPAAKPKAEAIEDIPIPENLRTPGFLRAWAEWVAHRVEIKHPLKPTGTRQQLRQCAEMGPIRAVAALQHSMAGGYQGIFEAGQDRRSSRPPPSAPRPPLTAPVMHDF